jgi:hypothetical protein
MCYHTKPGVFLYLVHTSRNTVVRYHFTQVPERYCRTTGPHVVALFSDVFGVSKDHAIVFVTLLN